MMNGNVTVISDVADAHHSREPVPDEVDHPKTGEHIAHIGFHSTDRWRGYYEATPVDGWVKVGEGTNCGDWSDVPPGTSNAECEAQIEKLAAEYGEVVLVLCGSSNKFATPYDVLTPVGVEVDLDPPPLPELEVADRLRGVERDVTCRWSAAARSQPTTSWSC